METHNGQTPIDLAIAKNKSLVLELLIANEASEGEDSRVLHVAAQKGKADLIRKLILAGANVNAPDMQGATPLCLAVRHNQEAAVRTLLSEDWPGQKIQVDKEDKTGVTPLLYAVVNDFQQLASMLLAGGANANFISTISPKMAPIHECASKGSVDMAKILLAADADPGMLTPALGVTALHVAAGHSRVPMMEFLLSLGVLVDIESRDRGETALQYAAQRGQLDAIKFLVARGADVNHRASRDDGRTPLFYASRRIPQRGTAQAPLKDVLDFLVQSGAKLGDVDDTHGTVISEAVKHDNAAAIEYFILKGVDTTDLLDAETFETALLRAASLGKVESVRMLLAYGDDIEVRNKKGQTPLMRASLMNQAAVVTLLLERRASVLAADLEGYTALHYAAASKRGAGALEILMDHPLANIHVKSKQGVDEHSWSNLLHTAVRRGAGDDVIDSLMKRETAFVKERNEKGLNPLVLALKLEKLPQLRFMLARVGSLAGDAYDTNNESLLHHAVRLAPQLLRQLIDKGADVDRKGPGGIATPLYVAAALGLVEATQTLMDAGASPRATTPSGRAPLHVALENGREDVVDLLLKHRRGGRTLLDMRVTTTKGWRPILSVLIHEDLLKGVQIALARGCSTEEADSDGEKPLVAAIRRKEANTAAIVDALLDKGADPNSECKIEDRYISPLVQAILSNKRWAVQRLLSCGAEPNKFDTNRRWAPLFVAVSENQPDMVEDLCKWGADMEAFNSSRFTPLLSACKMGRPAALRSLLTKRMMPALGRSVSANALVLSPRGHSAVWLAIEAKNWRCAEILLEYHPELAKHAGIEKQLEAKYKYRNVRQYLLENNDPGSLT
jgi:ankyrin repeat protein